jgi:hypothetical protein
MNESFAVREIVFNRPTLWSEEIKGLWGMERTIKN